MIYLRSQSLILSTMEALLRDTANARWTDAEIYGALNSALLDWSERVYIPMVYDLPDGFSSSEVEYELPPYITPPITLQWQMSDKWIDVPAYQMINHGPSQWYPDDGQGVRVRLGVPGRDVPGRVIWSWRNKGVPTTGPRVLYANVLNTDEIVNITGVSPTVPFDGFIQIDREYLWYYNQAYVSPYTALTNVVRMVDGGYNSVGGVTHTAGASVDWCVAATRQDLFGVLQDQMRVTLHEMYLTNAAPGEMARHQQMVSFYATRVQDFWRNYFDPRPARLVLGRIVGID